ncbi:MAG: indole-3-glycerol phosphate synthase TrpC [Bryobacteraceae bacterium]
MTGAISHILGRIVSRKRDDARARRIPRHELERRAVDARAGRRDFRAALIERPPAVIAEIKKASPSQGLLRTKFEPEILARAYEAGGAAAITVQTDEPFFQGSLDHLTAARAAVRLPVLRKDFTLDEYHVLEAAARGADAILLIVAILDAPTIRTLRELAASLGMAALVEVHDNEDLAVALEAGADIVGVNNRDLRTFVVSLETSVRLASRIPAGVVKVSESGIRSVGDVRRLMDAGYQAILVGEHLMRSDDASDAIRRLRDAT